MTEETKVLKIKTGEVYIDKKSYNVFQTAWKKTSKDGKTTYYEMRTPVFVQTVKISEGQTKTNEV